jgi:hypothetical protein
VDYKGIDDPPDAAFCPVTVKPQHAVLEQPKAEHNALLEKRRLRRRLVGQLMRNSFVSSRTLMRGWLSTTTLGLLSAVPLIGQLLACHPGSRQADLAVGISSAFPVTIFSVNAPANTIALHLRRIAA